MYVIDRCLSSTLKQAIEKMKKAHWPLLDEVEW
jgi:hypothetical protein